MFLEKSFNIGRPFRSINSWHIYKANIFSLQKTLHQTFDHILDRPTQISMHVVDIVLQNASYLSFHHDPEFVISSPHQIRKLRTIKRTTVYANGFPLTIYTFTHVVNCLITFLTMYEWGYMFLDPIKEITLYRLHNATAINTRDPYCSRSSTNILNKSFYFNIFIYVIYFSTFHHQFKDATIIFVWWV